MSFLYFVGEGGDRSAIDYADVSAVRGCSRGPGDQRGNVIAKAGLGDRIGYFKEKQVWRPIPHTEKRIWVGMYEDSPPREEQLRRPLQLTYDELELQGQRWRIPIARSFVEVDDNQIAPVNRLSSYFAVNEDGEWTFGDVEEQFEPLWSVGFRYWDHLHGVLVNETTSDEEQKVDVEPIDDFDLAEMAAVALQANYRLGPVECSMLKLLSVHSVSQILNIVIDLKVWETLAKKKISLAEPLSESFGLNEDMLVTSQAS